MRESLLKRTAVLLVPVLTAFVASFCIMVIELVAARVIARHLGSSLYTWTSVIGVVLTGITIGNLVGGRLADRFRPSSSLAVLFLLASGACLAIPSLNDWVRDWRMDLGVPRKDAPALLRPLYVLGDAEATSKNAEAARTIDGELASAPEDSERKRLQTERERLRREAEQLPGERRLPWSIQIFLHVFLVFILPATLLGTIGPLVAKMALDQGRRVGKTVGNVYAWGALGSIAGTFLTGFWLISWLSTKPTIWAVGGILGVMGLLYALPRFWRIVAFTPAGIVVAVLFVDLPYEWVERDGTRVFREKLGEDELFIDESDYSRIKIDRHVTAGEETRRDLVLDNLIHSEISLGSPADLRYDYERIYQALTHRFSPVPGPVPGRKTPAPAGGPACLFLGGGGYVFPRYVRAVWPEAHVDVAEIDPAVTAADVAAFGLRTDSIRIGGSPDGRRADGNPIQVHHLDARNHVDDLLRLKGAGAPIPEFDFVYGDAFNFLGVPFHLTTKEFDEKVKALLRPGTGIYLINVIDIFRSGRFVGAIYNTFREVFGENVYALCTTAGAPDMRANGRDTFILVGALRPLDLNGLPGKEAPFAFRGCVLTPEHLAALAAKSRHMVLTDDYAPVENLLEYVVNRWSLRN